MHKINTRRVASNHRNNRINAAITSHFRQHKFVYEQLSTCPCIHPPQSHFSFRYENSHVPTTTRHSKHIILELTDVGATELSRRITFGFTSGNRLRVHEYIYQTCDEHKRKPNQTANRTVTHLISNNYHRITIRVNKSAASAWMLAG